MILYEKKKKCYTNIMPILYGYRSVVEALKNKNRKKFKLFITKNTYEELRNEPLITKYMYINFKSSEDIAYICGSKNHNGIALEVENLYFPKTLPQLKKRVILLSHVTDTGNLGAIIRSAGIFSYDIILSKHSSAPINGTVGKNSAGGLEYVGIHVCSSLLQVVKQLKKENYFLVGATEKNTNYPAINTNKLPEKILLVMGGEEKGIPQGVMEELDFIYTIEGKEDFNVFNVSVAAALSMWLLK